MNSRRQLKKEQDYDFTRNDKVYKLIIPSYVNASGLILYEIHLKDLVNNQSHTTKIRFKVIKDIHDQLASLNLRLPPFPKTHFWHKTNKDPALIEERRFLLQKYLNHVINNPHARGYKEVKKFVALFKHKQPMMQSFRLLSEQKRGTSITKSRSYSSQSSQKLPLYQTSKILLSQRGRIRQH